MKITRLNVVSIVLVLVMFGIAVWFYPQLPDLVPSHWNAVGEVDGYTAKPWGVLLLPTITLGMLVLMLALPTGDSGWIRPDVLTISLY